MIVNEKRIQQQVRNFEKALDAFKGNEPLARHLTRFFKENKQMGSSDRRMTSRFCYNYFRIGKACVDLSSIDRLVIAEYLCEQESDLVKVLKPEWATHIHTALKEKLDFVTKYTTFNTVDVFPFLSLLSGDVDSDAFLVSLFTQPDLFIRLKRRSENQVKAALLAKNISFKEIGPQTLALRNGTKLQDIARFEGQYEVQDLSSQKTIEFIEAIDQQYWWDACAASGGKALMFWDKYPNTELLVSDLRLSILRNLDERFAKAKIKKDYGKKVIDLTKETDSILHHVQFDGVILDAPCSGSGTWGRTPEMIQQFALGQLSTFTSLQKNIAKQVVKHLKPAAAMTYITCSVFKEENEGVVQYITSELGMRLDRMEVIKGYKHSADSMFAARLIKI